MATHGRATILRGDARSLPLADESVDLVVTSPPYFALRSYTDGGEHYAGQIGSEPTPAEYIGALVACTREWVRVLKPSGSIWVNLGDKYVADNRGSGGDTKRGSAKYAPVGPRGYVGEGIMPRKSLMFLPERYRIACVDELGLIARAVVVWSKPNGLPESVTDRVRRSHEDWVHLTKLPRYFSAVDEIREPTTRGGMSWSERLSRGDATRQGEQRGTFGDGMAANPLGKLPGSVWTIATEPLIVPAELGIDHFAAFPTEWPRRIILGWSPSGICVECGAGRRPVLIKTPMVWRESPTIAGRSNGGTRRPASGTQIAPATTTITGYACDCPEPSAPTRPAVVLDPFGGTGTTALAASVLGRHGVSVDMSADYCRLARWRTADPGQIAKFAKKHAERSPGALLTDRQRINYAASAGMKPTKGRHTQMATTEETREAFERKAAQRRAAIEATLTALTGSVDDVGSPSHDAIAHALHAGIAAMVAAWREESAAVEKAMRRGWKSRSEFLLQAAAEAAGFAGGLTSPEFLASLAPTQDVPGALQVAIPAPDGGKDGGAMITGSSSPVTPVAEEADTHLQGIRDFISGKASDLPATPPAGPQIPGAFGPGDKPTDVVIHDPATPIGDPGAVAHYTITKAGTVIQNVEMISIEPIMNLGIPTFLDPPTGPKRLSWDDFALAVEGIEPRDHASFSSITELAECGMKYALGKMTDAVPAWWLVGGTAFHLAVEGIEQIIAERPADWNAITADQMPGILQNGWANALAKAIADQEAKTPTIAQAEWLTANKGMEGYDWWRVTGVDMLKRYVSYWAPKRAEGWSIYVLGDGRQALELDLSLDVDGERFQVIIDQVWRRPDGSLWIDDLKAGKSTPASTLQLGGAAWALAAASQQSSDPMFATSGPFASAPMIGGAFYKARESSHDKETADLLAAHPWSEMRHLVRSAMTMIRGKAYLPRVSDFGGGCSSCGHKAICPARG